MENKLVKTIIVDDRPLYLMGLKVIITNLPHHRVTGCCKNTFELMHTLSVNPVDIVIISGMISSCIFRPLTLCRILKNSHPSLNVVTLDCDNEYFRRINNETSNISGNISSDMTTGEISCIIDRACPSRIPDRHLTRVPAINDADFYLTREYIDAILTKNELNVVNYLRKGLGVTQISTLLGKSPKTISAQKRSAWRKMSVKNDAEFFTRLSLTPQAMTHPAVSLYPLTE